MADQVYLKREWISITFMDDEITVGVSSKMREWCIDVDNRANSDHVVYVRAYDDDEMLGQKEVDPASLVRVCLNATQLRLYGYYRQTIKYAFPWVLYETKSDS
jgi:hypothetical protein